MDKQFFRCLALFFVLLIGDSIGWAQTVTVRDDPSGPYTKLVKDVWDAINTGYHDATFGGLNWQFVGEQFLKRSYNSAPEAHEAIRQMLARLNSPATRFLNKEQFAAFRAETGGQAHIGAGLLELGVVDINESSRKLQIVTTLPDTPARRASLLPGDVIETINGAPTDGLGLTEAMARIRGLEGASLTLGINRASRKFEVKLVNEKLPAITQSVRSEVRQLRGQTLGYLRQDIVLEASVEQMRAALQRLEQQHVSGLILDLRNNPGGDLRACLQVAGMFLGDAPFVSIKTRTGLRPFKALGTQLTKLPLIVLVNKGTSSAAEALAAALQANKRAVLIGQTTSGKGLVHNVLMLDDGSAVLLPLGSMQTVTGAEIWQRGVTPEQIVNLLATGDAQYERAVELLFPTPAKSRKP